MAKALGDKVHYKKAVVGIRSDGNMAEATCADGSVYRAKKIICSIPFAALRNVKMDPVVPGAQGRAIKTMGVQKLTQSHIVAKKPFWTEDGLKPGLWTDGIVGNMMAQPFGQKPDQITSFTLWHRGWMADQIDRMPEAEAKGHHRGRRSDSPLSERASWKCVGSKAGRPIRLAAVIGQFGNRAKCAISSSTSQNPMATSTSAASIPRCRTVAWKARWNRANALRRKCCRRFSWLPRFAYLG